MKKIRNIIFDLGGVVIDLNRDAAVKGLEDLGVTDADELLGLYGQKGLFLDLEEGKASPALFFDEIRRRCGKPVTDAAIEEALNRFLVRIPVERLQLLRELRKKGYRTFVLSNTNAVMFSSWIQEAFSQEGLRINDYFDGVVKSFDEGICKPDPAIFKRVLNRYSLDPTETVMLDDGPKNCEAARSVGMQAIEIGLDKEHDMHAAIARILAQ